MHRTPGDSFFDKPWILFGIAGLHRCVSIAPLRYRCALSGAVLPCVQSASVVQKYVGGVLDICRICREVTDEFRPTWGQFCPTPGAKFSQFRPTAMRQLQASKRLARAAWGEIRRISPHEKKKKFWWGEIQSSADPSDTFAGADCSAPSGLVVATSAAASVFRSLGSL